MSEKLYALKDQYKELALLAETADEDMAVAIHDTMGAIEAEFKEKAVAVSQAILNIGSDIDAIDAEIERLKERKRVITNRQGEIKKYLRQNMEASGITKISCPLFSITLAKGRESVVVDSDKDIPDELMAVKTSVAPDKKLIADRLKQGIDVPGCRLERGESTVLIK